MDCAVVVRRYLGEGFLESVYRNALMVELRNAGLSAEQEVPLSIYYKDGSVIGEFRVDILVEKCLILELKATTDLTERHEIQLVNYLKATKIDDGLLINFGGEKIKIKRKFRYLKRKGIYERV